MARICRNAATKKSPEREPAQHPPPFHQGCHLLLHGLPVTRDGGYELHHRIRPVRVVLLVLLRLFVLLAEVVRLFLLRPIVTLRGVAKTVVFVRHAAHDS